LSMWGWGKVGAAYAVDLDGNESVRAWLALIRNHFATGLAIEYDDFEYAPFK